MSSASDGTGQYQPLPSSPASPAIARKAPGDDGGSVSPCRPRPLPLSPSAPSSRHNDVATSSGSSSESTSGDDDDHTSSSESGDVDDDDSSDSSSGDEDSGNVPVAELRPKRPTHMDLAWRQVALGEAFRSWQVHLVLNPPPPAGPRWPPMSFFDLVVISTVTTASTTTAASSSEARSRPTRSGSGIERYVGGIARASASEMSQENLPGRKRGSKEPDFDVEAAAAAKGPQTTRIKQQQRSVACVRKNW
eukprot:CAMPEP_0178699912 /NCGR_PEP_ID=MMETSP0699-20121125/11346_1 /TAXON_ID=265572 /ORGANISM="Extubocellulus spinifer, Strain CCMP396" /LENGTH=248 /DNA_ID=CAMNT_0020346117 /DNA_START=279 /DNA_END=1027 /DNA_ORIENTATION=-